MQEMNKRQEEVKTIKRKVSGLGVIDITKLTVNSN